MRLILIRHPESAANVKKLVYGHTDWGYSEKGQQSVRIVSEFVVNHLIESIKKDEVKIYTSPLKRASDLAHHIAEALAVPVEVEPSLIEMNVGIFENLNLEGVTDQYHAEWESYLQDFENYRIPEGESFRMVYDRVSMFADRIKDGEGTAIVVCHAMVIRGILMHLLDLDFNGIWQFNILPASITELEYRNGRCMVQSLVQLEQISYLSSHSSQDQA